MASKVATANIATTAISNITGMTNSQLWDYAQRISPQFQSHTSKGTYETFAANGYEQIEYTQSQLVNEWFEVLLMPVLQVINMSHAKDPLEAAGFGETYNQPNGGIIQRMSINSIVPMTPSYKGLENGDSVDPFVVYKPTVDQRFFTYNYDYQSMITIQDYQVKQIFASAFGMSEFLAGIMEGLQNGYTIQQYENTLEAINAGLNSEDHPLQDTQVVRLTSWTGDGAESEIIELLKDISNIIRTMQSSPQQSGYNAAGYATTQDISRLKLLIRPGILTNLQYDVMANTYHDERLNLPVDTIEVQNFGGLVPYQDSSYSTQLYPVYDSLGHNIGFNTTEGASEVTVQKTAAYWKDPNANVLAVLADRGWVFRSIQNPYTVEPIHNPRGMYNNYFANSPHNAINVDTFYNVITFCSPS